MRDDRFPNIHDNAMKILKKRKYLWDKGDGTTETVDEMFMRVAKFVALPEKPSEREYYTDMFFSIMRSLRFMPNTPTLINAGRSKGQLAACFVLPLDDSMESIMDTLKAQALVQKTGGGTGFSFSKIRERGALISTTNMRAVGPVPIIEFMNYMMTRFIVQGGVRNGANMAVLPVDHPDVMEFIKFKHVDGSCPSFNVSLLAPDAFMEAVISDGPWTLKSRVGAPDRVVRARDIFDAAVESAWATGDPGMLFEDTINRYNPTPHIGKLEATNPCGEQALLPNEACTLGHLNLSKYYKHGGTSLDDSFDWDLFEHDIRLGVRFLDNVIEVNYYPLKEIEYMHKVQNRKIGLGVMGLADLLIELNIPYDSEEARAISDRIGRFYRAVADDASHELGKERGSFGSFEGSAVQAAGWTAMRNACRTTVAPTGTTAIIAGASTGIEPVFALALRREQAGMTMHEMHRSFERELSKLESNVAVKVLEYYLDNNTLRGCPYIPESMALRFQQANDVSIDGHVDMQAVWQKHVDNAISKTINMPSTATVDQVRRAYLRAWASGCKGITVYRDKCRANQALSSASSSAAVAPTMVTINADAKNELCKECGGTIATVDGCEVCNSCGWSACSYAPAAH